ncbi:uncharacterized protein LOC109829053 [Asparagus officinalis]|uniref:uncharacterized protein LOC109829053 n=1 Tax=Asparagus officinalis TaxID=4686 RepID=UPI00098E3792|nr:uncharacterized protein LOC109829053 [Asparagus officinalis]XP_020251711.1 uncharacterized protein LOC109829053 [Asparagus officinalis]XP_020251712.1 uncharacterized protein LOC109829053 [Asparagus officinalis]
MYSDLKMSHTKAQVRAGCKVTERKVVVCPRSSSHQFAKMSIIALIINATPPHSSPQFSEFWHRLGSGRNFIEEVSNDKGFNIRTTIVSRLESVKWRLRESSSSSLQEGKKAEPHDLKDDPLFLEEELRNVHIGVGCDTCGMYPITGKRYRCKDCKEEIGFDLCETCYNSSIFKLHSCYFSGKTSSAILILEVYTELGTFQDEYERENKVREWFYQSDADHRDKLLACGCDLANLIN